jgi:hypothetical protein
MKITFKRNLLLTLILVSLSALLCGCTNKYEDAIYNTKVGDIWQDSLCEWTALVEANENWNKYEYRSDWAYRVKTRVYYVVGKDGRVLAVWKYLPS